MRVTPIQLDCRLVDRGQCRLGTRHLEECLGSPFVSLLEYHRFPPQLDEGVCRFFLLGEWIGLLPSQWQLRQGFFLSLVAKPGRSQRMMRKDRLSLNSCSSLMIFHFVSEEIHAVDAGIDFIKPLIIKEFKYLPERFFQEIVVFFPRIQHGDLVCYAIHQQLFVQSLLCSFHKCLDEFSEVRFVNFLHIGTYGSPLTRFDEVEDVLQMLVIHSVGRHRVEMV